MSKILIIAEAGVNHNGSLQKAKKLIEIASKCGADVIKFQTFNAEMLATKVAPKAKYQKKYNRKENQYEMLKKIQLKRSYHKYLMKHAKKYKIEFLSSAFSLEDLDFLKKLKLNRYKIPSGEIDNYPFLEKISKFKKEIILSTGMSKLSEIKNSLKILTSNGLSKKKITILHCISEYPTEINNLNLNAIKTIKKIFKTKVGFSDHSKSIFTPLVCLGLGINVIEKHLTINNNLPGPDHKSSLNPKNFKKMVNLIRAFESSLGSGKKLPTKNELNNLKVVRKSIVAKTKILKGEKFSYKNLTFKRPGTGISPMKINKILKTKSKINYEKDDLIKI